MNDYHKITEHNGIAYYVVDETKQVSKNGWDYLKWNINEDYWIRKIQVDNHFEDEDLFKI